MSVRVDIAPFLRHFANGATTADVNGTNVGECIADLVRQFPHLRELILDSNGKLHTYMSVLINGSSAYPEELSKPVNEGDEIYILNVIAGG